MLDEILGMIHNFVVSPLGQIALWGAATFWTLLYTLITVLDDLNRNPQGIWRVFAVSLMSVFWVTNIVMWFSATIYWMLFSDLFFMVLTFLVFLHSRQRWAFYLTLLYSVAMCLDIAYWCGLSQHTYAWLSNITFAIQLVVVSGFFKKRKPNRSPVAVTS